MTMSDALEANAPRLVEVYRRGHITVVSPMSMIMEGDFAGAHQPTGALIAVDCDDPAVLGHAVREGLDRSGAPLPTDTKSWERELHRLVGVRSRRQLIHDARLVAVEGVGSEFNVSANPRDPDGGGWGAASSEPTYLLRDPTDAELGEKVNRAFALLSGTAAP